MESSGHQSCSHMCHTRVCFRFRLPKAASSPCSKAPEGSTKLRAEQSRERSLGRPETHLSPPGEQPISAEKASQASQSSEVYHCRPWRGRHSEPAREEQILASFFFFFHANFTNGIFPYFFLNTKLK